MASRTCSECKASLRGKISTAKTCSNTCRVKRQRRTAAAQKRRAKAAKQPEHLEPMSDVVTHHAKDALHAVVTEELRPIVRESITEDVLLAIDKMVRLTPRMIDLIERDMESPDTNVSQKAYTLLARYTLGNQSVAPQPAGPVAPAVTVNFDVPRPTEGLPVIEGSSVEEHKPCMECQVIKPESQFVSGSDRCETCHAAIQATIRERFG